MNNICEIGSDFGISNSVGCSFCVQSDALKELQSHRIPHLLVLLIRRHCDVLHNPRTRTRLLALHQSGNERVLVGPEANDHRNPDNEWQGLTKECGALERQTLIL